MQRPSKAEVLKEGVKEHVDENLEVNNHQGSLNYYGVGIPWVACVSAAITHTNLVSVFLQT